MKTLVAIADYGSVVLDGFLIISATGSQLQTPYLNFLLLFLRILDSDLTTIKLPRPPTLISETFFDVSV